MEDIETRAKVFVQRSEENKPGPGVGEGGPQVCSSRVGRRVREDCSMTSGQPRLECFVFSSREGREQTCCCLPQGWLKRINDDDDGGGGGDSDPREPWLEA